MADSKISALTPYTTTIDTDVLPIVDVTAGITKKITIASIKTNVNPTVPVKASAAEIDTGSDDAKFATAAAISGSHNVPNAVPSTTGNIMTSDGTDWISSAAPAGGDALMTQVFY